LAAEKNRQIAPLAFYMATGPNLNFDILTLIALSADPELKV